MKSLVVVCFVGLITNGYCEKSERGTVNSTLPKDMYVVHATVYQVGILTNKTDDTFSKDQGHQEAITFYRNNGSDLNLSGIRNPLMTNVTAQSIIGIAPMEKANKTHEILPWTSLEKLASLQPTSKTPGGLKPNELQQTVKSKRDVTSVPVKIDRGSATIPPGKGIQSLALPPLLTLNQVPVPIPNTSVVHYAKINTLVKTP
ncbi:uncharacterized protein [Battus philenor]|uniref:uncharacterized protein isoform X2 n=1 Tax=Battus philenor TaxID=42288 RepID=UPI0035CEB110